VIPRGILPLELLASLSVLRIEVIPVTAAALLLYAWLSG
jgi:hypothetical protein